MLNYILIGYIVIYMRTEQTRPTRQHSKLKRPPQERITGITRLRRSLPITTYFSWILVKGNWIYNHLLFVLRQLICSNLNMLCNKENKTSKITAPMTGFVGVWKFGEELPTKLVCSCEGRSKIFHPWGNHLGLCRPCMQICKPRR
jgi:hypothetical protein